MKEYKIAILGTQDSVLGFKALGLDVFGVSSVEDSRAALDTIQEKNEHAGVFITEDWMEKLEDRIAKFSGQSLPAILPVPSQKGSTG